MSALVVADVGSDVLQTQDGVLTTAQAVTVFGRAYLRSQHRRGTWRSPARGVWVLHNGPLTESQRRWVALLAAPVGSVIGGITALRLDVSPRCLLPTRRRRSPASSNRPRRARARTTTSSPTSRRCSAGATSTR